MSDVEDGSRLVPGVKVRVRAEVERWGGMTGVVERAGSSAGRAVAVRFDEDDVRDFEPGELVVILMP